MQFLFYYRFLQKKKKKKYLNEAIVSTFRINKSISKSSKHMNFSTPNLKDFYKDHSGKSRMCICIIIIELMINF